MSAIKQGLRRALPQWLLDGYRRIVHGQTWFDFADRSRAEVFTHIYRTGMWGRGEGEFYSGPGSDTNVTAPYVAAVRRFIESHGTKSVVDIGCGDFRVGALLLTDGLSYHGIDIVPQVVEHNRRVHGSAAVKFSCLDVISSDPPPGDLCLVREVFQHLSNEEIGCVLVRCRRFPHVVVTEKLAAPEHFGTPNVDINHGPNTRADIGSGVVLDAAPFTERVVSVLVENRQPDGTILRSVLIDNTDARP